MRNPLVPCVWNRPNGTPTRFQYFFRKMIFTNDFSDFLCFCLGEPQKWKNPQIVGKDRKLAGRF